jgi:membrane protease YdiL (CAAX protease family)
MEFFKKNKNLIAISFFIIVCLFLYKIFPTNGNFQNAFIEVIFLFLLPLLYYKVILGKKSKDFGFIIGDWKKGLFWSLLGIIVTLFLMYIFYNNFNIKSQYIIPTQYSLNFWNFIFYEFIIVFFSVFIFEFFFRAFILYNFIPYLKSWTILLQFIIFLFFLYITGSFLWAFAPYIIFSLFAGISAYKSNSIFYSLIAQFILIILIDTNSILLFIK